MTIKHLGYLFKRRAHFAITSRAGFSCLFSTPATMAPLRSASFTLGMEAKRRGSSNFFRGDIAEFRWYADLLSDTDVETVRDELVATYLPSTCAESCTERRARFGFNV